MKRVLAITVAIAALAAVGVLIWGSVSSPVEAGKNGPAGKSNMAHLYLFEKDYTDPAWPIVDGGAWGKMRYNQAGEMFDFVFNGHGLVPDWDYTLIYYPDPWPGEGLVCLGSDVANMGGNVHIKGYVDTGPMPMMDDDNYSDGAKIWLVSSQDVDCDTYEMVGWDPVQYLFEYDLITFTAL